MTSPALLKLREARSRLRRGTAINAGLWALAIGTALLALGGLFEDYGIFLYPIVLIAAFAIGGGVAFWRWNDLGRVATRLDAAASTKDRFVSALAFTEVGPMENLAHKEIGQFARDLKLPASLHQKPSVFPAFLLAASLAIIATGWTLHWQKETALAPERHESSVLLEKAQQAAKDSALDPQKKEEIARKLEEALRKLATSTDPRKDALRAISEAEKSLGGSDPFSAEEMTALAQASAAVDPSLSSALASPSQAAADKLDTLSDETLRQIVQQAAQHQATQRLQQLSQQSGSELRKQMIRAYTGNSGGKSKLSDELQNMRLASTKDSSSKNSPSNGEGKEQQSGNEPASGDSKDGAPPGGGKGQELDVGKGQDVKPDQPQDPGEHIDESLSARSKADGPSTIRLGLMNGDDHAQAQTGATGDLAVAEAAALDAVARENVPIGSRILVRRYFEDLRRGE